MAALLETLPWVVGGMSALGASLRWNWWRWPQAGVPVLMYHHLGAAPALPASLRKLWVSAKQFEAQLQYLQRHGYRTGSLAEFERAVGEEVPSRSVLLTFDDGYASVSETAFPLLTAYRARAVVFLVAEGVGRGNVWRDSPREPWVATLTWSQIRELQRAGIEFGCHGMTHRNLLTCDDEELRREVTDSKRFLEDHLGQPVAAFAYPFGAGAFEPRIRTAVAEAGYLLAFSIRQGKAHATQDRLALHRVLIRGDDSTWDFALNVRAGKARF